MTKKDYIVFAEEINRLREATDNNELVYSFAIRTAEIFRSDNPRFSLERFMSACGFEGW